MRVFWWGVLGGGVMDCLLRFSGEVVGIEGVGFLNALTGVFGN